MTTLTDLPFDPDALRAKYRAERDKRLRADGNEQYVEVDGRVRALRRRPLRRAGLHARAADRRGRGGGDRRRLRRPAGRRAAARGRRRGHPHHREGRRLRRHLVLEPLSRRRLRRRVLHLPAAARRARLRAEREVLPRAGDPRAQPGASASSSTSTATPASRPRSPSCAGTRTRARWIVRTNRGDACAARFVGHGERAAAAARSCPASPASRRFKGHTFHTSRWDYDYTGGDSDGDLTGLPTSASASSAPARPPCSACRTSARAAKQLYVFQRTPRRSTCATTARPIRSGRRALEPAGSSSGWTTSTSWCPAASRTRTWSTTAGPTSSASCSSIGAARTSATCRPTASARTMELADFQKMEQIRARVDAIVKDPATAEALKP